MTRVGIVAKPDAPRAKGVIAQLLSWLSARGLGAVLEKETVPIRKPGHAQWLGATNTVRTQGRARKLE